MNNASQYRELETELKAYIPQLESADGFPLLPQYPAEDRINRLAIDCFDRPIFMRQNGNLTVFSFDGSSATLAMLGNGTYRLEEIESRQPITRCITKNIIGILKAWAMRAESARNAAPAAPATPATDAAATIAPAKPTHNADFTMVRWYGAEYQFSPGLQAASIKELWREWEKTGFGLHQETIRQSVDAERDTFRLSHVFRDHPAYGVMIQSCGEGKYRLTKPDASAKPKTPHRKRAKIKAAATKPPVIAAGLSPGALRAKQKIEAEHAAAHPED